MTNGITFITEASFFAKIKKFSKNTGRPSPVKD
jgi:hypothetical protein